MPFLYQTRTIAGLHRSIFNGMHRNRILPSSHRTNFHTYLPRAGHDTRDRTDGTGTGPQIKMDGGASSANNSIKSKHRPRNATSDCKLNLEKSELESEGNIAQSGINGGEEEDPTLGEYGSEIDELASPNYPKGESTITDTERETFSRIFSHIYSKTHRTSLDDVVGDRTDRESARTKLDKIMMSSLSTTRNRSKKQQQAEIKKYPLALRAAAARAMGLDPDEIMAPDVENLESGCDPLDKLREPERKRVEGLLRDAKTDFELWEVLEKEVFPLIGVMGLAETKESRDQQRRGVHDASMPPIEDDPATPTDAEPEVPPLAFYGPIYPSHLLLGLRLLDRGFCRPSPLALALLPRIKSFGLLSHVLGTSTPFYNELLRIFWLRRDNFIGCLELLNEMQHAGLEFDSETLEIVTTILKVRAAVWKGEIGLNKTGIWSLSQFKKTRNLQIWQQRIARAVQAKLMSD